jgi:pimeloyl-ACP methyl ester carboxylesterase
MTTSIATTAPTQFLDAGDTRFAYRRFGNPTGTPVVFTQHFMGNLDNFDPAISDALAAGREVILFDNAGVASSTGTAPNNIADMAADAARFIDELGLATVDIVGHSMGGETAQIVALERPDLVRRLVLVGTGPRGGEGMCHLPPDVAALFTKWDALGEDMWLPIMFSPSKESQAAGRAFTNRITARTQDRDIPVSDSTIAAYRAAANQWGTPAEGSFEYLSRIAQPTLIVNGNNDIIIPTINSYHLYQNLPNGQLWLLPDANHGAHFQYPALFARRVIDFLDIQPHETSPDPPNSRQTTHGS